MRYKIEFELPDNDTVLKEIKHASVGWKIWGYSGIAKPVPSIDAVQVVQCKDCLFNDGDGPNEDGKYWCALHQSFMQYCSEAERKES